MTNTVDIPAGVSMVTIAIEIVDDRRLEGDETVAVVLDYDPAYSYYVAGTGRATVTITDDERGGIFDGTGGCGSPTYVGGSGHPEAARAMRS